jgi:hypothetical protein
MRISAFTTWMAILLGAAAINVAHAQNATLAAALANVFDAHNAAVKSQDVAKALGLRATDFKRRRGFDKKPDAMLKSMYLAYVAGVTPASYRVEYAALEPGEQKASLGIVAELPDDGAIKMRIVNLTFTREGGAWKMGQHEFWMVNADELKRPKNTTFEPEDAYDRPWQKSGRIVKTTFDPSFTLVMLRDNDVESAVFLPAKGALAQMKMRAEDLEPGNKAQFSGMAHKQDDLKMWAKSGDRLDN